MQKNNFGVVGLEDIKKVRDGQMVDCQECHTFFYGNRNRQFCNNCLKKKTRERSKEYHKRKKAEKEKGNA